MQKIDLTGQTFGYLTVIREDKSPSNRRIKWVCKCKCGDTCVVASHALRGGRTSSCGCKVYESKNQTHGMSHTRLYEIWCGMKKRCYNSKERVYNTYGGRGITVCDEWRNNFLAFYNWSMLNGYSDDLSIDRIDNDGNYEPSNCRWATFTQQQRNTSKTKRITVDGVSKPITEWCDILGITRAQAESRYNSAIRNKGICSVDDLTKTPSYPKVYTEAYYNRTHTGRKVAQFSKSGDLIKTYDKIKYVKQDGFNPNGVLNACRGWSKTASGYIWRYVD